MLGEIDFYELPKWQTRDVGSGFTAYFGRWRPLLREKRVFRRRELRRGNRFVVPVDEVVA